MTTLQKCRACGSHSLTQAFQIDGISAGKKRGIFSKSNPARFFLCDAASDANACGLVQSSAIGAKSVESPPSGHSRVTRSCLRAAATEALELISGRDCAALDIGCSDGTLLSYYPRWVERFGVDTDEIVESVGDWAWTARSAFPSKELDAALGKKKFDIVTAISVLEEIDEPRAFLARAKQLLTEDGVLVIETLYAPMTLTRTGVDAVANGARALYSLGVMERLLRDCDLKIFRGALTEKNGGSLRIFATHECVDEYDFDPWYERLAQLWDEENALSMRAIQPYHAFEARAAEAQTAFFNLMQDLNANGANVHILGADGAAEQLYSWAGEHAGIIEAAVSETHISGRERLCVGGPAIINENECRAIEPDYLLVPAPMKRDALEVWRDPISRGLSLIFATPSIKIVNAGNFAVEFGKSLTESHTAEGGVETLRTILSAAGGPRLVSDRTKDIRAAG